MSLLSFYQQDESAIFRTIIDRIISTLLLPIITTIYTNEFVRYIVVSGLEVKLTTFINYEKKTNQVKFIKNDGNFYYILFKYRSSRIKNK